jgi:hypothetical protein
MSTLCIATSGGTFWARDHGLTASGDAAAVATLVAAALRRAGGVMEARPSIWDWTAPIDAFLPVRVSHWI